MSWKPVLVLGGILTAAGLAWWLAPGPFWRGVTVGVASILLLSIAAVSYFALRMRRVADGGMEAPPVPTDEDPWDYALTAHAPDGAPVDLAECRGRVLVLNRWATWCRPCLAEMPSLRSLEEKTSDVGVRLLCVTTEDRRRVEAFVAKHAVEVPVAVADDPLPDRFRSRAIPATFVIDPDGRVAFRHVGAARWDDARVVAWIREMAARPVLG